ncbi:rCG21155, isoform CRA_a [Rattus norvegicus]|uniref:RCG21155, isoform CRA_a n=1 Tax=Rattus norvegicus TaxID=10116 RepID=A6J0F2_RAT|nr:rCG21155, isoform CRA_a [Rattus norvegicus]
MVLPKTSSRMIDIQTKMTERALELLCLPEGQPSYLLDIGCGSGLSGDYISEEGHYWVGIDISPAMLASLRCSGSATQTRSRTSLPGASTASFLLCTLPSSVGPELSCSCTPRTRSSWS